ncbi:MAG: ABC-type multidrug transport system ATPase subunit [Myxococcota bacterium]|jgi:ABC-type multidrug transport system ATPase subunit
MVTVALEMIGICARYPAPWLRRGPQVLHDITLRVDAGERVALIGPSGGGKSTIARIAVGLLRPSAGTLRLFGEDTHGWTARQWRTTRQRLQLLPQAAMALLPPGIPVRLALEETAALHGIPQAEIAGLVHALELTARVDAPPEELSGGELRRIGMGRVLLARPALLIADEPTAGLDLPLARRLLTLLDTHLGDACAQIHVSHTPRQIRGSCDRLVVVDGGRLLDDLDAGAPDPTHATSRALLRASGWFGEPA